MYLIVSDPTLVTGMKPWWSLTMANLTIRPVCVTTTIPSSCPCFSVIIQKCWNECYIHIQVLISRLALHIKKYFTFGRLEIFSWISVNVQGFSTVVRFLLFSLWILTASDCLSSSKPIQCDIRTDVNRSTINECCLHGYLKNLWPET